MKYWLTTDTHLGHFNMVEYCGRPENFSEIILRNLHQCIKHEDILIHLGDICIANDTKWHLQLLNIPGRHWLIRGNHDKKSNSWYLEHGWDMICQQFEDHIFGKTIMFSHKPVVWNGKYEINIHGHFHNTDLNKHEKELVSIKNGYQKLLALEYVNYMPVTLEKFIVGKK